MPRLSLTSCIYQNPNKITFWFFRHCFMNFTHQNTLMEAKMEHVPQGICCKDEISLKLSYSLKIHVCFAFYSMKYICFNVKMMCFPPISLSYMALRKYVSYITIQICQQARNFRRLDLQWIKAIKKTNFSWQTTWFYPCIFSHFKLTFYSFLSYFEAYNCRTEIKWILIIQDRPTLLV